MSETEEQLGPLLNERSTNPPGTCERRLRILSRQPPTGSTITWILFLEMIFILSVILNLLFGLMLLSSNCNPRTSYAQLKWEKSDSLWWNTDFSSLNETDVSELWTHHIPWEKGIIALEKSEAQRMGPPESQPFPWDHEKSIYILNGHHILHCVRNIYISIQEYRQNRTQSVNYPHILHCLDSIRLETMCTADDTPRYVPPNPIKGFRPGDGQNRLCRDWKKLDKFVEKHDPCYKYVHPGDDSVSNLERFKYCSNDSPYLPAIRMYFGYEDNWVPWPQSNYSSYEGLDQENK